VANVFSVKPAGALDAAATAAGRTAETAPAAAMVMILASLNIPL
jgi:hypothetical protein